MENNSCKINDCSDRLILLHLHDDKTLWTIKKLAHDIITNGGTTIKGYRNIIALKNFMLIKVIAHPFNPHAGKLS